MTGFGRQQEYEIKCLRKQVSGLNSEISRLLKREKLVRKSEIEYCLRLLETNPKKVKTILRSYLKSLLR